MTSEGIPFVRQPSGAVPGLEAEAVYPAGLPPASFEGREIAGGAVGEVSRNHFMRRWLGRLAALSLVTAVSGVGGSMLFPARTMVGPHHAEARLTMEPTKTLDFGMPGSIIKPEAAFAGLGIHIDVKEMPDATPADGITSNEITNTDLETYAQFLSDPEKDIAAIRSAVTKNAIKWAAVGDTAWLGLFLLLGKKRRQELCGHIKLPKQAVARFALAGSLAVTAPLTTMAVAEAREVSYDSKTSEAFNGTPLEGTIIRGKLLQVAINKYGVDILDYIERNKQFYDKASENLKLAFEQHDDILAPDDDTELLLFETDLHCNIGMTRVIGTASRLYKPLFIIDGGDTTVSGSQLEEQCITPLQYHTEGIERVTAPGNHDSSLTEKQEHGHGFKVLDSEVVDMHGVGLLGDDDPRRSVFGQEIRQERDETLREMGHRLAEIACEDGEKTDILVVHDLEAAEEAARRGCIKLALGGHSHKRELTLIHGANGVAIPLYQGASSGGATHDRLTLGPLQAPAEITVVQINKKTKQPLNYQVVTVQIDASITIEDPVALPYSRLFSVLEDAN